MASGTASGTDETTVTLAHELDATDLCLLVGVEGAFTTHTLPRSGEISIGRAATNVVCIDHPSVSRQHACLRLRHDLEFEVEDLGSANGTRVGDQILEPHRPVRLAIGDVFELGAGILQVRRPSRTVRPRQVWSDGAPDRPAEDSAMALLRGVAEQVAASSISVLILGETGVGKEILARSLHRLSPRAAGTFLALNCAALPENLLESELFGHEKGAFTGAGAPRVGLLESAAGGTVFLDEVGDLPPAVQVKLLRVLEDRCILRIGAVRPRPIDVRFIAATNRDLEAEVRAGRFREDLYFRLNGVPLVVPPLRERSDEIEELAGIFIREACARDRRAAVPALAKEALDRLRGYRWPGNVRELRNLIDRAVLLCRSGIIRPADLAINSTGATPERPVAPPPPESAAELHSDIQALERQRISSALERCAGNQKLAAKQLGISRNTLSARMDAFGLPRPRKSRS